MTFYKYIPPRKDAWHYMETILGWAVGVCAFALMMYAMAACETAGFWK